MRHLICTSLTLALAGLLGCGDSGSTSTPTDGDAASGNSGSDLSKIVYPDALCTDSACIANSDTPTTCDPNATDPDLVDCSAWRINGTFSLSAIKLDQNAKRGRPAAPSRTDDDACPPNSKTPEGKETHCCERVSSQPDAPAFLLTGITLLNPPVFRLDQVSSTNKMAIEEDRYNWVMQLSSGKPGNIIIKSGLGLHNEDGSFAFADGPFELGGKTWNTDGAWDPHEAPGVLGEDGTLRYASQYVPQGRYFQLPLWGKDYKFTMMVLSMSGVEMEIKLSEDQLCAGYLTGNKTFNQIGSIKSYLPLEPLRDVQLHFTDTEDGIDLCQLTASIGPGECDKPVSEWGK